MPMGINASEKSMGKTVQEIGSFALTVKDCCWISTESYG
jgi:hypothetical protein